MTDIRFKALLILLLLHGGAAHANAGLPLLNYHAAYSILLFIPVVAIETLVVRTGLKISVLRAFVFVGIANIASTAAGLIIALLATPIPIAPTEGTWADGATLVLLVPFFFLSVWIERRMGRWHLKDIDRTLMARQVFLANVASYSMFVVFVVARIIKSRIVNGYFV